MFNGEIRKHSFQEAGGFGDTLGLAATIVDVRTRFGATFVTVSINLINQANSDEVVQAVVTDCYEAEELGT